MACKKIRLGFSELGKAVWAGISCSLYTEQHSKVCKGDSRSKHEKGHTLLI